MVLRFGPLRLRLHGSRRWLDLARRRYSAFLEGDPEDRLSGSLDDAPSGGSSAVAEIRVDYRAEGDGPSPRLVGERLLGPMDMRRDDPDSPDSPWHLSAPGVTGTMDAEHIRLRGPLATFPLDSAMIALWSLACGAKGAEGADAAVVHGALLADDDRGWLCTGPSGVGKSTLAGLLPHRALCDELVGVRVEDGELMAYALPFWRGRPGRVRLLGVHFLAHGSEHGRRQLTIDQAFSRIHSQILWPSWCPTSLAGAFRIAAALADLPADVLSFRPEPSVWRHVAVGRAGVPAGARPS